MTLAEKFEKAVSDGSCSFRMKNRFVLRVRRESRYRDYDFLERVMTTEFGEKQYSLTPFSQVDREVLGVMRDKLLELGGEPPDLPEADRFSGQGLKSGVSLQGRVNL